MDTLLAPTTRLQRLWQVLRDFVHHEEEHGLVLHALSSARRPTFSGTESTAWSAPSFATYVSALHEGDNPPSSVGDAPAALKRKIAGHSLLGDPSADNLRDLTLFPVVNPRTGKLNGGALRAVLGGRGSQANISDSARTSAQTMARSLLNSQFDAKLEAAEAHSLTVEQTDMDIRQALQDVLKRELDDENDDRMDGPSYWSCPTIDAVDIANQTFTYYDEGELRQRAWTVEGGVITLAPLSDAVQRSTSFIVIPGTTDSDSSGADEADDMDMTTEQQEEIMAAPDVIKRRVNALIANERTRWTEEDRHMLEAQGEAFLIRLEQQPLEPPPVISTLGEPTTAEEAIARMPSHLRETLLENYEDLMQRKTALVETILANKHNDFTREELEEMRPRRLEKLVVYGGDVVPGQAAVVQGANYTGRRLPPLRIVETAETEAPPPPPETLELVVQKRREMGLM